MTVDTVLRQALELSEEQRAELIELLVSSLDGDDAVDEGYQEAWTAEIDRRVGEIEDGTAELIDAKDALRQIRERLARRPR